MSNYYAWECESGKGACAVKTLKNVDAVVDIKRGRPVLARFPSDACFHMDPKYPKDVKLEDQICNREMMVLVSPRLRDFVRAQEVPDVEFLQATIYNHKGTVASPEYTIIHPCRVVDCIDKGASDIEWNLIDPELISGVESLVLDASAFGADEKLIRPRHLEMFVFVREDLAHALMSMDFGGPVLSPVSEFTY